MKYSQPDQAIEVTARKRAGMIRIVVQDHGIGIPERDLPSSCSRSFAVRFAKNAAPAGLSLAWYILKLHGGNLEVESFEGHGHQVTMIVPETNTTGLSYSI